jgi:hypothetical protein
VDVADSASVRAAAPGGRGRRRDLSGGRLLADARAGLGCRQVEAMCDVNLTGCARVMGQALPAWWRAGAGMW